jgi:hypothetical protein
MEAAALYEYAEARQREVVCLARVTNTMAVSGDDFEKGPHAGARITLDTFVATARALGYATSADPKHARRSAVTDR